MVWSRVAAITAVWGGFGGSLYLGTGSATIINSIGHIINIIGYMGVSGGHGAVWGACMRAFVGLRG